MSKTVSQLVEEQITRWRLERARQAEKAARTVTQHRHANVITLTDAYGAGGTVISKLLGEHLGLPIYNREIVAHIASTTRIRAETVELLDERALSAVEDYLTALWHEKNFDRSDYARELARTITALWGHGPAIFVGHGAGHIVPRQYSLAVRLTAPRELRVERIVQTEKLAHGEASRKLQQKDTERETFIRRLFNAHIDDTLSYDLVLNTAALEPTVCAAIIEESWRRKFPM